MASFFRSAVQQGPCQDGEARQADDDGQQALEAGLADLAGQRITDDQARAAAQQTGDQALDHGPGVIARQILHEDQRQGEPQEVQADIAACAVFVPVGQLGIHTDGRAAEAAHGLDASCTVAK